MVNKKVIGVDVDGVLADLIGCVVGIYNSVIWDGKIKNITYDDIIKYDVEEIIGQSVWDRIMKIVDDERLVRQLNVHNGAIDGLIELEKFGKVVYVTAPYWSNKNWINDRVYWLTHVIGMRKNSDVVFTSDKSNFGGDLLIDDAPHHLQKWIAGTGKPAIKFKQPWNMDCSLGVPANNWEEVVSIAKKILEENG